VEIVSSGNKGMHPLSFGYTLYVGLTVFRGLRSIEPSRGIFPLLRNFDIFAEFHGILHKLIIQQRLIWFLTWWHIFIAEKIKLNCQKLWNLLIIIAIWHNR